MLWCKGTKAEGQTPAEGERDALEEARELAMQYRAKDIAHVENSVRINLHNEAACAANVEQTAADLARIQEKVDYETGKLATVSEEHAALEVRLLLLCSALFRALAE